MDQLDQLLTIAEISVALAGFAGLISTFQKSTVSRGRVLSLSMIVNISLFAAFFAVLPIGLSNFGLEREQVWSLTSLVLGFVQLGFVAFIYVNIRFQKLENRMRFLFGSMLTLGALLGVANFLNAFGLVFKQEFSAIFVTFVFNLGIVCFNFSRLLLYPLWKLVEEQDSNTA